jgi:hypothetical protein
MRLSRIVLLLFLVVLAACNARPQATPTSPPSPTNTIPPLPTRTPFGTAISVSPVANAPTPLIVATFARPATSVLPPTSILPPTAVVPQGQAGPIPNTMMLMNGRGITTGSPMSNGNFEVEGYCALLNPTYGVGRNDNDWYCSFQGQEALVLRQEHFDDICRRTYNNALAVAYQIPNTAQPAFAWRCLEYINPPTATPQRLAVLAMNGRGMTTGSPMNNGNFEVEAYCTTINASYGVTRDDNYWYCTQNGQRIITLGIAEFDDICIRTYNNPAAYAEQIQSSEIAAFRWRCFILQ